MSTVGLRVNVKGSDLIFRAMRNTSERISTAQYEAGEEVGKLLVREAKLIIRSNSPKSSGELAGSIKKNTNKINNGYNTRIYSDKEYAGVVESGGPAETKRIDASLAYWIQQYLPKRANYLIKRGWINVRTGNNPKYDTATGMKFFQIPFNRHRDTIFKEYQKRVLEIVRQAKK